MKAPEGQTLFSSLHRLGRNACEARIFTFGGGVFDTHLDWYLPARFWSTVATATSTPLDEIQLLHLVRNSPQDLATEGRFAFLLQSQADRPSSPLLRVTLVDIEYKDMGQSERKVLWIQNKINRPSLLRILRLESLCWWPTNECRVWQNGYEIPTHQVEPLAIFDGDHLKISVALRLDTDTCDSSLPTWMINCTCFRRRFRKVGVIMEFLKEFIRLFAIAHQHLDQQTIKMHNNFE